MVVLPASWSQAWEALWGSIFRAGRPGCPLTHICFYKYSLSKVGGGRMFTRSGKGGLGSKDKKNERRGKEEVRRKRSAGVGGLWRGSEGPTPRIFLCGCSFGLAQVTEGGVQDRPLARGVETLALRPLFCGRQNPASPGIYAPGPSRTPSPWPPAGWVSPCGLRQQRCWPGGAAGRWGKAGRSPLQSGEPPLQAPGKPEADERRCPLLGLGTTRGRRQKRVRGEKVTQTPWPRPTPLGRDPRSSRGRDGDSKNGRLGK